MAKHSCAGRAAGEHRPDVSMCSGQPLKPVRLSCLPGHPPSSRAMTLLAPLAPRRPYHADHVGADHLSPGTGCPSFSPGSASFGEVSSRLPGTFAPEPCELEGCGLCCRCRGPGLLIIAQGSGCGDMVTRCSCCKLPERTHTHEELHSFICVYRLLAVGSGCLVCPQRTLRLFEESSGSPWN